MNMKNMLGGLKCAVLAALTMGLALGAEAENVAEVTIGGTTTQYSDLSTAWSACKDQNATLKLLKDVDITSELNKSWADNERALSLDLNGHTLKQTGSGRIISVHGTMTISNGFLTRNGEKFSDNGAGILVCHNDDDENVLTQLVMRDVTMTNCVTTKDGGAIYAAKDTQVMLENCTLRQNGADGSGGAICTEGGATNQDTNPKAPWDKLILISTVITDNTAVTSGAAVYYKYTVSGGSCFAAGTKVLMADGSEKVIEEVKEGDCVRTFDHEGGTNSTAAVFMTVKEPITTRVFVLAFAGGSSVRCVLSHDFLMKDGDTCKYVCLSRKNAADYVGKSFYAADGKWHELLSVTDGETVNEVYEIYSSRHLNSYADGMMTVPADVAHVLNVYKLGADLKADAEQLAADIAAYGYFPLEKAEAKGMSRAYYDAFGAKYCNIIVGKGLMTWAQMGALYQSTGRAARPLAAVALGGGRGATALPLAAAPKLTTTSDDDDLLKDYPVSKLTLGTGTIVTNNLVGTKPNNIYLEIVGDVYSLIALANDRAGICAGVTPQWTTGQITAFGYANPGDIALFRSDNADCAVWYEASGAEGSFLKLAAGSQIVPPALANASYEIWVDGELVAQDEGTTVEINSGVKVVYTADDGYVFDGSGATTKEVTVDTSKSVATMTPPAAPFEPAASVTTNGVTTVYSTLTGAWAEATTSVKEFDVLVMLLKDATVDTPLQRTTSGKLLTLDLNDKVLAYAGANDACVIKQAGGTMHIIDTATTRTPHYFTCDKTTGLWTLANEATGLTVAGGLITGGRASALEVTYGGVSISNVNFVGNSSAGNGGAVLVSMGSLTVVESAFFGNVSAQNGGAISAINTCEMSDCHVEANVATNLGGGVYMRFSGSLVRTSVVGNKAGKGGGVYLTFSPGCFPAGVKILMADGSEKNVEDIVKGDEVATFDHVGGTNSSAAVFYVYSGTGAQDAFTLTFVSDAANYQLPTTNYLSIVDRHDLLSETTRKYVTVSSDNARTFIGSRFYNYATGGWDELVGVTPAKGGGAHYSIYVAGHANCVANGLLTVPDDKDCFINVYELDENLKADAAQLAADIETYGLATPSDYPNIPEEDFEDGNIRFARIAIGKGLTTQEEILFWNEFDYGPIVEKKAASVPKLMMSATPMPLTAGSGTPSEPYLKVGEGVVVTGNVTFASASSNVYLDRDQKAVICVAPAATDIDVGVTLSNVRGVFTDTSAADHLSGFASDNSRYTVARGSDGRLWIATDLQVGGDAWADLADGTCEIFGEGDMWSSSEWTAGNPLAGVKSQIRNVAVEDGVTGIGDWAFQKFYALTNVVCASSVTNVGIGAFSRCLGIEAMKFAGEKPTLGDKAFTVRAGIYMEGGEPVVYPIPKVTYGGVEPKLWGTDDLTNPDWQEVNGENKGSFHFFTYEDKSK